MKKIKIHYFFIFTIGLFLAVIFWSLAPWLVPEHNRVARILARGELRVSTLAAPLTVAGTSDQRSGLDYELAQKFAHYLNVRLRITVRQNISQLFDDLDNGNADLLASALVDDQKRSQHYQTGPAYYTVSQQLVYRIGTPRPRSLADIGEHQLTIASGQSITHTLAGLKKTKYPNLSWQVDNKHSSHQLLQQVVNGNLDYTITDSAAINLFQRIHPQLAVALDVTDEQSVNWFSVRDDDNSLSAALLDFFHTLHEDGSLSRLQEKYFGHGENFDYVDTRHFLQAVDKELPVLQALFEKYASPLDWRLLAAVAWQESHWNASATSPTGVRGIMMLTRETAQSLGLTNRLDAEQSIRGGASYLKQLIARVPKTVPDNERIWFALAAYNMGYAHMMDARALTALQKGNPDSWADVKQRLPLLSQKTWYSKTSYGYAPGRQAYEFVENVRKYRISLSGYLQEKKRKQELAQRQQQQQDAPQERQQIIQPHPQQDSQQVPPLLPRQTAQQNSPSEPMAAATSHGPVTLPLTPFSAGVAAEKTLITVPNRPEPIPPQSP